MRLAVVTPIYAPYRTPVFRELARQVALLVIYCAPTEHNRDWTLPENLPYEWGVVSQQGTRVGHRTVYPSLRLIGRLGRFRPDAVVAAGFSLPRFIVSRIRRRHVYRY